MRDFGWIELKEDHWLLKKPLKYNTDPFACKRATMNLLVQLSKEYDKLYIPYSGGNDSAFICLCYKECLEKNLLYKDIYSIYHCNFNIEGQRLQVDWERAKYWYDKYINLPINYIDIDIFSKEHFDGFISTFLKYRYNIGVSIQFYMLSLMDAPSVENAFTECLFVYHSKYYKPTSDARPNSIEVSLFEGVAFSCINPLTFLHPPLIFTKPEILSISGKMDYGDFIFQYIGKAVIAYWLSFPQIFELCPKRPTVSLEMAPNTIKIRKFLRFYEKNVNLIPSHSPMEEGGRSLPLLLPDGQPFSSIEQTQEFFNV